MGEIFSDQDMDRREFLRASLATSVAISSRLAKTPNLSTRGWISPALRKRTPIFMVDNVSTYAEQIACNASCRSSSGFITNVDPHPEDPPLDPGSHYYHLGLEKLLQKMASAGFPLWKSERCYAPPSQPLQFDPNWEMETGGFGLGSGYYGGPNGIIASNDVVLIKINAMGPGFFMVNLDILKGLIQRIVDHPDGFEGEILVVDKYFFDDPPNSFHEANTVSAVCNAFPNHRVSRIPLRDLVLTDRRPSETEDGYVDLEALFPDSPFFECLSYPKLTSPYGTKIDFARGVWNGDGYDRGRLRVIGYSILKDHFWMGMTCALKNFLGMMNIGTIAQGGSDPDPQSGWQRIHAGIYRNGLLGRFFKAVHLPDLFLIDATQICAQHPPPSSEEPFPILRPRKIVAGFDPVNLDYYCSKEILASLPIKTPCGSATDTFPPLCPSDLVGSYPCSSSHRCRRHDPDFKSRRSIAVPYLGPSNLRLVEPPPLDALRRYLWSSCWILHGSLTLGPSFYYLA